MYIIMPLYRFLQTAVLSTEQSTIPPPFSTLFSDASSLGWGPGSYHLFRRNCEHFANLCKTGSDRSRQIDASFGSLYPLWNAMKFMCIM